MVPEFPAFLIPFFPLRFADSLFSLEPSSLSRWNTLHEHPEGRRVGGDKESARDVNA